MSCSRNRLRYSAYASGAMKTSRNSVKKGAVKRKPAAPCRAPALRFARPPGTRVTGEEMVAVASLMSKRVVGGGRPAAGPLG
jgi:hypothetical protein